MSYNIFSKAALEHIGTTDSIVSRAEKIIGSEIISD